ncbi:MAG: hypothetical protein ACLR6B_01005 [Blautia sp.]
MGAIGVLGGQRGSQSGYGGATAMIPTFPVDGAWKLSETSIISRMWNDIYRECDYITIHVPLLDSTKEMINAECPESDEGRRGDPEFC